MAKRYTDEEIIGHQSNRLTVLSFAGVSASKKRLVRCKCDCGNEKVLVLAQVMSGAVKSCGCMHRERAVVFMKTIRHLGEGNRLTHGMTDSPEFYIWNTMKQRCLNPRAKQYKNYGGRGIGVCERWLTFENFLADMGERPSARHSIDRINNDGNYEPGNCRWATRQVQANNMRSNVMVTHNGETLSLAQWAKRLGLTRGQIRARVKAGMTLIEAITTPRLRG